MNSLSTYNTIPYDDVTNKVKSWLSESDIDDFSRDSITVEEVQKGISTLNSGKTPGLDGVIKEHLMYAGRKMVEVLVLIFNWII